MTGALETNVLIAHVPPPTHTFTRAEQSPWQEYAVRSPSRMRGWGQSHGIGKRVLVPVQAG